MLHLVLFLVKFKFCVCLVRSPSFSISESTFSKAMRLFVWKPQEVQSMVGQDVGRDEALFCQACEGLVVLDALDVLGGLHVPEAVDEFALQISSRHDLCESEKYDATLKNRHKVAVRKLLGSLCRWVGKLSGASLGCRQASLHGHKSCATDSIQASAKNKVCVWLFSPTIALLWLHNFLLTF